MKRTICAIILGVAAGTLAATAPATAAGHNWGQEVKACNHTPGCYPEGSRGAYVSGQAKDAEGPGYAWEIHHLANPGNADPAGVH